MKGFKSVLTPVLPFYFFYWHNVFLGAYASKMLALYSPELQETAHNKVCRLSSVISSVIFKRWQTSQCWYLKSLTTHNKTVTTDK